MIKLELSIEEVKGGDEVRVLVEAGLAAQIEALKNPVCLGNSFTNHNISLDFN